MNSVVETIYQQLGGRRFAVMTGSNHFVADNNTLRMTLVKNKSKANRLHVTYDSGSDLYTMRFIRITGGYLSRKTLDWIPEKVSETELFEGVFADELQKIFAQVTGLYTKL